MVYHFWGGQDMTIEQLKAFTEMIVTSNFPIRGGILDLVNKRGNYFYESPEITYVYIRNSKNSQSFRTSVDITLKQLENSFIKPFKFCGPLSGDWKLEKGGEYIFLEEDWKQGRTLMELDEEKGNNNRGLYFECP